MPQEAASANRDGYGGEFGLELVGRIVDDLDRLLTPDGEVYFLSASPVIHGQSLLEQLVQRKLASTGLGANFTTLHLRVDPVFHQFQKQHGMRHEIVYLVKISRQLPHGVRVRTPSAVNQIINRLYVRLANMLYR